VEYSHMLGLVVMDHCQDSALTAGAVMHEGHWSLRLGLKGWPAIAEDLIIGRNILLAEHFGARIHMQHVSTAGGVELLRRARERGVPVSGEATPHHVYFTDADCAGYDTNFKMNPPLRTAADRDALIAGVLDGTIDIIATDHAPHTDYEKDQEFDLAPFGITGLEVALATMLEVFIHGGRCDLPFLLARMTHKPAALLGLDAGTLRTGADADVCIFDPNEAWTVDRRQTCSKSVNNPWHGRTLRGRVKRTLVRGQTVWSA
jgi:dihydroorotase